MAPSESPRLRAIREFLNRVEASIGSADPAAIDALGDLAELMAELPTDQERKIASNRVRACARRLREIASQLMTNGTDTQILVCHQALLELERSPGGPDTGDEKVRLRLLEVFANRHFTRLARKAPAHSDEDYFVASREGRRFHKPSCEWAREISDGNLVTFSSHKTAANAGFQPCLTCKA